MKVKRWCAVRLGSKKRTERGHAIDSRRRQSDEDLRAVIREGHRGRTGLRSEPQPAAAIASTGVVGGEKGVERESAASDVSKRKSTAKSKSGGVRNSN